MSWLSYLPQIFGITDVIIIAVAVVAIGIGVRSAFQGSRLDDGEYGS